MTRMKVGRIKYRGRPNCSENAAETPCVALVAISDGRCS